MDGGLTVKKRIPSSVKAILSATFLSSLLLAAGVVFAAEACSPSADCSLVISGDLDDKPSTRGPALEKADIAIGNHDMFTIQTNAAGFTIAERERIVYMRLTEIISNVRVRESAFSVVSVRGKPTICIGPYRLITIYPRDAEAAGCTSEELATDWMGSLIRNLPWVTPVNNLAWPPKPEADATDG